MATLGDCLYNEEVSLCYKQQPEAVWPVQKCFLHSLIEA